MSGVIGDNVYRASGVVAAAAAGGGAVSWQTGSIKTAGFTPTAGEGYFINTTAGAITITLAAGVVGEMVGVSDYAQTFATNNLTITPNGTDKIGGTNADSVLNTTGQSVVIIYVDSTRGWIDVTDSTSAIAGGADYMTATVSGSCNTLSTVCTDYKVAKFVNPGCFTVCATGTEPEGVLCDYLVVAGGGSGGRACGGGGGAGGYRESGGTTTGCYTVSPLGSSPSSVAAQTVSAQAYPVAVGGGGAAVAAAPTAPSTNSGNNSSFACITSAGGGGGGFPPSDCCGPGLDGGSGGGAKRDNIVSCTGQGNVPPTSPAQGFNGGAAPGSGWIAAAGGGGALALGGNSSGGSAPAQVGGPGGPGATSSIDATPTARAGGGGGTINCASGTQGTGGPGGGGNGSTGVAGCNGTALLGGGGGGAMTGVSGSGGSGIVYIRYKFQ